MNKILLNRLRYQYVVSKLIRIFLTPIQKICKTVDKQIKMKVWVNGETVNYDGVELNFPRNIGIGFCSSIYWNGVDGFEPYNWRVMKHFILQSNTFIDVGSNIGFFSILAKKIKPAIMIQSYEPIPSIFEKNIAFHKINNLPTTHIINAAIGDANGEAEIFLPVNKGELEEETTATLREDSWQFNKKHETIKVETKTLNSLLKGKLPTDKVFIKIDVEDYEASVLKGATEALRDTKPIIVCEILSREHHNRETFDVMHNNDYVTFGIINDGLVRFGKTDHLGSRTFRDFLFLPAEMASDRNFISFPDLETMVW